MKGEEIFLGSDHAGFDRKETIKKYLQSKKIRFSDFTPSKIDGDDYPDAAFRVGQEVSKDRNKKGILVCGSGTGMVIAANKVKGVRAVIAYDKYSAQMSKKDNDCNVLCLRGRQFPEKKSLEIVKAWLSADFSKEPRHSRRIKKISSFENK